ncbi:MAG TPA: methyltransferase domain-containing protein [Xanthobacteraceae bacterium]|nr:methyltransferase domain-containing protein [Xanthobacteraceae bacterium]
MITTTRTFHDETLETPAPARRVPTGTAAATALMNRIYRRQRHIYDLTRRWFLLGRNRLIAELAPGPGDAVLEIGCGTGRNLILAARRYPQAQFFGIDVSTHMLTSAIEAVERAGLTSRVRVAHADATAVQPNLVFGRQRFERIMISYSLSMIPDWGRAIDVALALLASGGRLTVVDFGRQERLPAAFRALLRAWLALFHVKPVDTLETELALRAARDAALASEASGQRGHSISARAGHSPESGSSARIAKLTVERPCRGYVVYAVVDAKT